MIKRDLRNAMTALRAELVPEWVCDQSSSILCGLIELDVYIKARCVACYVSIEQEVDTHDLIHKALVGGKQVGVPVTYGAGLMDFQRIESLGDMRPARFGLLEPEPNRDMVIAPEQFDLAIVPGVAFDRMGYRVGMGGGYYDRFLKQTRAIRVGVAYGFQVVNTVPVDEYDLPVDIIVTEREVITCDLQKGASDA